MRRIVTAAAAVMLLMAPAAAQAATHSGEAVIGAEADWSWVDGNTATELHIRVVNDRLKNAGSPSARTSGVNLQMYRFTTDRQTGATVTDFLMSDPYYASASTLDIHRLVDASVVANVTLTGMRWSDEGESLLGPYVISVAADWQASGLITRDRRSSWSTEFGWVSRHTAVSYAPATAQASIGGDLPLGELPAATGQLVVLRDSGLQFDVVPPSAAVLTRGARDASSATDSHVLRAVAGWSIGDDEGTELWLTLEQPFTGNAATAGLGAYAEMFQGFCDVAADESVMRMLTGERSDATGSIAHLRGASGDVSIAMRGIDMRRPGCDASEGEWVLSDVSFDVSIRATWVASGPLRFVRDREMVRAGDEWSVSRSQARGRQADARGAMSGDLGELGLASLINAYLEDRHEMSAGTSP